MSNPNTVENNLRLWDETYAWPKEGDEWSEQWGGTKGLWDHFLLPRINQFLPAPTILEIAPGHGRWTQFLADHCQHLFVVDLSPACIEHCKKRFANRQNISYFTNDGRSLDMIADGSLDFVFSYDSLVHADASTVEQYVRQLQKKLRPGSPGFIHHSNAAPYKTLLQLAAWMSDCKVPRVSRYISRRTDRHWRALNMPARGMAEFCHDSGMTCTAQEVFAADALVFPIDCLSTVKNSPSDTMPTRRRIDYRLLARKATRASAS
jgi:ubiquinone/menaquinone biosynthesis C-methylase UbiE